MRCDVDRWLGKFVSLQLCCKPTFKPAPIGIVEVVVKNIGKCCIRPLDHALGWNNSKEQFDMRFYTISRECPGKF